MGAILWLGACGSDVGLLAGRPPEPPDEPEPVEEPALDPIEEAGHARYIDKIGWEEESASTDLGLPSAKERQAAAAEAFFAEGTRYDLHLSLPSSSRSSLAIDRFEWVPATLTVDARSWDVEVRLKGTGSFRDLSGKAAFKINFAETDPDARFHGLKRLTLGNMMQDSSMLHEHVAYWLYRHRGVPAPRHTYARLWVDDTYYGLYGVVETMDEQFLRRALPDDNNGNLYEANVSDFVSGKTRHFDLEEEDGLYVPYEDIDAAIALLEATPPEDYVATLRGLFHFDLLLELFAIELVTANVDGYTMFANNYMAYHGEEAWYLLPWGHDQCFEWYRDVHDYSRLDGRLVTRCVETPDCLALLDARMLDLVADWEQGAFLDMVTATTALIEADCVADPRAELACDVAHVTRFVQDRPASIREELAP